MHTFSFLMVTGHRLHSGHVAAVSLGESCRRYAVCMYR